MVVHNGCTQWLYTMVVHNGCTQWLYTIVVHNGCTQWLCTMVVHNGCAQWLYTMVVHNGCSQWLCTRWCALRNNWMLNSVTWDMQLWCNGGAFDCFTEAVYHHHLVILCVPSRIMLENNFYALLDDNIMSNGASSCIRKYIISRVAWQFC